MKKLSLIITAVLIMSFIIIPTSFVQAASMDEVIRNVEQTNIQINEEIEKAVYAAQGALDDYNYDLMVLLDGKEISKIYEVSSRLQYSLKELEVRSEKQGTLLKRIFECNKVANINNEEIQKLEDNYNAEIDRIINNLLSVTNSLSAKMIEAAANEGITVYCEWIEVTLGGTTVLVDPLRIANY